MPWGMIAGGLARTAGAVGAGVMIERGVDADTLNAFIGAITAAIIGGWSIWQKVKSNGNGR